MFFCIGENNCVVHGVGMGETIETAISNWATSSHGIWADIIEEFNRYDPTILQGQKLNIELECPPPIIKIL